MEQGAFLEGCPYCRVLRPHLRRCPLPGCGSRLREARMLDEEGIHRLVADAAEAYDGSVERWREVLDLLHLYHPVSLRALERRSSLSLERLRADDRTLEGLPEDEVTRALGPPASRSADRWIYPDPGPANHHRGETVLDFEGGRVVRQRRRRVAVPCDTLPPGA